MHQVPSFLPAHPARPLPVLMDLDDLDLLAEAAAQVRPAAAALRGYLHPGSGAAGVACLLVGLELLLIGLEDTPVTCRVQPAEAGCASCWWERGVVLARAEALVDRQRMRVAALLARAAASSA